MDAAELKTKVETRQGELRPLYDRMDIDRDIVFNAPYTMPDLLNPKKDEPQVANVSLPIGKLYFENAVSSLSSAESHVEVTSNSLNDKATTILENFLDDAAYEIDAALSAKGEPTLNYTLFDFLCGRGSCGAMLFPRVESNRLLVDARPIDSRYLAHEFIREGLGLLAPTYERSAADVEEEYKIKVNSKSIKVIDAWAPRLNCTWVGDRLVKNEINAWGFVPGVFQGVGLGTSMREANAIERKWESIFNSSRDLYKEANFIFTILKTQNYSAIKPAQTIGPKSDGSKGTAPSSYPVAKSITEIDAPLQPVDTGDLKNYTQRYYEIINILINQATSFSLEPTEMGDASAVAISRIQANRSKMQQPRFDAANQFRQRLDRLFIRQVFRLYEMGQLNSSFELGGDGHARTYNISDLEGEYRINYSFYSQTIEDLAAGAAVSNALGDKVSDDYKRRNILRIPNPDGEKMKQRAELAERLDPVISLIEQGHALIDEGTDMSDLKARRILKKIKGILKQESLAEQQPLAGNIERGSNSEANPTQALPLFGGAMSGGKK